MYPCLSFHTGSTNEQIYEITWNTSEQSEAAPQQSLEGIVAGPQEPGARRRKTYIAAGRVLRAAVVQEIGAVVLEQMSFTKEINSTLCCLL